MRKRQASGLSGRGGPRMNRTRRRECKAQDGDDHAGQLVRQQIGPFEQSDACFKLLPQLRRREGLVRCVMCGDGLGRVPCSQGFSSLQISARFELCYGQTADKGMHHRIGRDDHIGDVRRNGPLT